MNAVLCSVFGWLVPGGAYLLMRRYRQFAAFGLLVWVTFGLGLMLHGGYEWPQPSELQGLDGFTALAFQAGAVAKVLAGGPYLAARLFGVAGGFLDGRLHEYGTTLLALAGIFNLLAVSNTFDLRKADPR
jgi:hypothetical protein